LLRAHPDVTGIFAANDVVAIGALGAARELGLRVPEDLSVIGYDDTDLASTRLVDLTTVDDRSSDVGAEAARVLLARLEAADGDPMPDGGSQVLLQPRLVVRGTTAAAPR
ncbi:MAG: substrate-binding domain-containing protein, partial [Galactobacter sp.]